jgi:sulfur carrier protein
MKIKINNQFLEFMAAPTAQELIRHIFPSGDFAGMALAVNQTVIPKSQWDTLLIQENDQIDIIKATQGG